MTWLFLVAVGTWALPLAMVAIQDVRRALKERAIQALVDGLPDARVVYRPPAESPELELLRRIRSHDRAGQRLKQGESQHPYSVTAWFPPTCSSRARNDQGYHIMEPPRVQQATATYILRVRARARARLSDEWRRRPRYRDAPR